MEEVPQTQFKTEGTPLFESENKETENSADSSTVEKTNGEQTQSDAGETNADGSKKDVTTDKDNLADHPRWKEREGDWTKRFNEQETRHVSELTKLREDFDQRFATIAPKTTAAPAEIPEWFNGDEETWSKYSEHTQQLIKTAVSEALKTIESKTTQETQAVQEATTHMNTEVARLETDKEVNPQGLKIDKNKLFLIAQKFDLVKSDGKWNWDAAFEFYKNTANKAKTNSIDEKKQLAGATTSDNRAETKPSNVMTSDDFKKPGARPW